MLIPSSDRASSVKIIDFGLAKLMPGYGISSQKLTETGYALGTCHYMAPEQCLGGTTDQRADIYSAGCIFYQCLTGKLPFDADDNVSVMFRHINDQPIPISQQIENTPKLKALQNVLDNCMAKDPDDRYTKADEVCADLERIIGGDLTRIKRFSAPQVPSLTKRSSRHNLWSVAVIALTGVALLGFFSLFNSWRGASSLRRDSNELAIELFRKWDSKAPNTSTWAANMEAIEKADALDHKLTPQQRLKVAQWLAHGYLDSNDKRKLDGQIDKALTIRASIAPRLRIPADELLFARTLNVENRPDLAVSVLRDLQRNKNDYPNVRWEFERARILLAEILIYHGHLDIAERNLQEQMRSIVTSKAEVHYRFLLGDINMLRKNYDAALKIYKDEKDLPHSLGAADWAALARVAIYKNDNAMAALYLKNSEQMCKEEFPPGPCETIVLLETLLAARQHDHEAAKKLLNSFRDAKQVSSAFTVHFRNSDRQLCVEALRAAGYNDLIKLLGFYAFPGSTPAEPLDTTSIN